MGEYLPAGGVPRGAALAALVGRRVKRDGPGRGLPRRPDDIRQLKVSDLRSRLRFIGIHTSALKAELDARLEATLEADNVVVREDCEELPVFSEAVRAEEVHLPSDVLSQHHSLSSRSDAEKLLLVGCMSKCRDGIGVTQFRVSDCYRHPSSFHTKIAAKYFSYCARRPRSHLHLHTL